MAAFRFRVRDLLYLTAVTAFVCLLFRWMRTKGLGAEEFGTLLSIWFMHAVIAAALSAPIAFIGRRRVHWRYWELLVLVVPFVVWCCLMFSELAIGKSLANLGEPFYFAFLVPLAVLARVTIGDVVDGRFWAWSMIMAMCAIAAAVFFIVPPLPE